MHLLLTGSSRTGKTTLLLSVLAPYRAALGGYYVTRHIDNGRVMAYAMCEANEGEFQPDAIWSGGVAHAFLTWRGNQRVMDCTVFDGFGTAVLRRALDRELVLLDEIGGIELMSDAFYQALETLLQSGTPCIGVFKSASALERMRKDVAGVDACLLRRQRILGVLANDAAVEFLDASSRDVYKKANSFVESILDKDMKR